MLKKLFAITILLVSVNAQAFSAAGDIASEPQICFTENEWNGIEFNGGEAFYLWTTGSTAIALSDTARFNQMG